MDIYDAGDEKQVRKRKTKDQLKREQQLVELKAILDTRFGRDLLWRMLERCSVFKTTFSSEPLTMAFNEGKRQIGLWLLKEINEAQPKAYSLMTQENNE